MSLLSKLTHVHIKVPGLSQVGGVIDHHLPQIGGAVLGSSAGDLLGHLASGENIGQAAKGAAGDFGKAAAGAAGVVGAPAVAGAVPGIGGLLAKVPGLQGLGSALGGLAGKAGDFLGGNGGLNALGVAQGVNAAMLGKQSSDYAKDAMGSVNRSYDERAPLRTAGIAGMLKPQIPDLSPLSAIASNNPYARKVA